MLASVPRTSFAPLSTLMLPPVTPSVFATLTSRLSVPPLRSIVPELVTLATPCMSPPCPILIVPELLMTLSLTGVTGLVASSLSSSWVPILTVPAFVRMESALMSSEVPMVSDDPVSSLSSGGMVCGTGWVLSTTKSFITTECAAALVPVVIVAG